MPGIFNVPVNRAVSGTYPTVGVLGSATTIRPKIKQLTLGTTSAPADAALKWLLQRCTALGTTTSVPPRAVDPSYQGLHLASAGKEATAEPTYTSGAIDWQIGIHQRQSVIINFEPGAEPTAPATANNGYGLTVVSSSGTPDVIASILYSE